MTKSYGQIAYEAYCAATDWKSLVSGQPLPQWADTKYEIRDAWEKAALAVATKVLEQFPPRFPI